MLGPNGVAEGLRPGGVVIDRAAEKGYAERDTAALMKIREDELGIKVRPLAHKQAA